MLVWKQFSKFGTFSKEIEIVEVKDIYFFIHIHRNMLKLKYLLLLTLFNSCFIFISILIGIESQLKILNDTKVDLVIFKINFFSLSQK